MPCAVPPALSQKGCDEKWRRRRNDESREPGIRNDVPSILGPEVRTVRPGRLFCLRFRFFFATTQFTKVGVRLTTWPAFSALSVKKEVSYSSWTGIFCRVESCRVVSCHVMSSKVEIDFFFSSSDGLSLLSVEAYGCYVYAEVTRACLTGRM